MRTSREQPVLVTGGAGFVGSHLVEQLVADGATVVVVDNLGSGAVGNLRNVIDRVNFRRLDIRESAFTDLVVEGRFQTIYHLAANAYVPPSVEDPSFDYETNLDATFRLLETIRQQAAETTLILASSAAVYGNPVKVPIQEEDPTVPVSPYGVSKLSAERYLSVFSQIYGLKMAALRIFSLYGPRQRKQVIFDLIDKLHRDPHRLPMFGDGSQTRDFTFVTDAVQALHRVAEHGDLHGEVYNLASGRECSILQLAHLLGGQLGVQPDFEFSGHVRPGDPERWWADIGRLRALGYTPEVPLEEGLERTVRWYQDEEKEPGGRR